MAASHDRTGIPEAGKPRRPQIGVGCRVGRLVVAAPTSQRKNGYTVWLCRCDCGGEILLDTRCLQRGTVTDCGCVSKVKPGRRDVSGMRFGRLVAVEPTGESTGGSAVWRCRCDCGGEVCVPLHQLTAGYRKSCGCLSRPPRKDYVGKRFGRLTVTAYAALEVRLRLRKGNGCGTDAAANGKNEKLRLPPVGDLPGKPETDRRHLRHHAGGTKKPSERKQHQRIYRRTSGPKTGEMDRADLLQGQNLLSRFLRPAAGRRSRPQAGGRNT